MHVGLSCQSAFVPFFVFCPIPKQTRELLPKSLVYCLSVSSLSLCSGEKISFLLKHRRLSQREFSARKQKPGVYFPVKRLRVEPRD